MAKQSFAELAASIAFANEGAKAFREGRCPACGCENPESTLTDDLSRKEFKITRLCQSCQDDIFG